MAKKTNKTSHVMNLLTNGASPETVDSGNGDVTAQGTDTATPADSAGRKEDTAAQTVTPARVTVVDEGKNDRVSQEILNKLSEELQEDLQQKQATSDPVSETENSSQEIAEQTVSMISDDSDTRTDQDTSGQPSAVETSVNNTEEETMQTEQNAPDLSIAAESDTRKSAAETILASAEEMPEAPARAVTPPEKDSDSVPEKGRKKGIHHSILPKGQVGNPLLNGEYHFVNVMEQLILRQDIDDYLRQYNVCTCERCVADVCALTLSGLPAKYVVSSKDSLSPLLSYYESKYKIYMLTEIIKACNKVRENPRHKK